MNFTHRQINPIRYNYKPKQPDDQQILSFQDNYVFRTNPSNHLSQSNSKILPKSQNAIEQQRIHSNIKSNNLNRFKNTLINNLNQNVIQYQQANSNTNFNQHNQKQIISLLKQKITQLTSDKQTIQQQNHKLKNYIQFLQDYNLRLKKQLTIALKRRNLDSSLQMCYQQTKNNYNKSHINSNINSYRKQNKQQIQQPSKQQYFSTIQPLQKYLSKPIFTNQRLANSTNHYKTKIPRVQTQHQINRQTYINPFYQIQQNTNQYKNKNLKMLPKYKKPYPYSLQSSFIKKPYEINPQNYQTINNYTNNCYCFNNQKDNINKNRLFHNQFYMTSLDQSIKSQIPKGNNKNNNSFICSKCYSKKVQKQFKLSSKSANNSLKNTKTQRKQANYSKQRCISCNKIKNNSNNNSKRTISTKQKTFNKKLKTTSISNQMNKSYQSKNKHPKNKNKIQISQFKV